MKKKRKDYIDEWIEWQENQYNHGHYIGRVGPFAGFSPNKPKIVGIAFYITPSFISLGLACWMFSEFRIWDDIDALVFGILFFVFSLTGFLVGYRYIQKGRRKKSYKKD